METKNSLLQLIRNFTLVFSLNPIFSNVEIFNARNEQINKMIMHKGNHTSNDSSPWYRYSESHYLMWTLIKAGVSNTRPANIRKSEDFRGNNELFCQINWFLTHNSKFLFSCGPRDITLSLMRPTTPFEFETPVLKVRILKIIRLLL